MATYVPLDLSSKADQITVDAGDDVMFKFAFVAIDTTGFNFSFVIYDFDGTTVLATLTNGSGITNTPVTGGGNSLVQIDIAGTVTASKATKSLPTVFKRTDTGSVRTFAKGPIIVK